MKRTYVSGFLAALLLAACSDSADAVRDGGPTAEAGAPDAAVFDSGVELRVPVPASGRVWVKLSPPTVVATQPSDPLAWDLAFEGYDVFTNSGPSSVNGAGGGSAFGPLDAMVFLADTAPEVPFTTQDRTGGAFTNWYVYDDAVHVLWNRYHVYAVEEAGRRWKVQLLSYYGERDGAPVSALYRIRYAEVTPSGVGPTQDLSGIDGTAGGTSAPATEPSACLDLGTGATTMLTPEAALTSSAWHLCFRRANVSVNGELGGPRGTGAVDLDADQSAAETLDIAKARTAETELARFDAVQNVAFDGPTFRGDRIISAFDKVWIDSSKSPAAPSQAAWLVVGADGNTRFLVAFTAFENPNEKGPGTVVMRVKPVR